MQKGPKSLPFCRIAYFFKKQQTLWKTSNIDFYEKRGMIPMDSNKRRRLWVKKESYLNPCSPRTDSSLIFMRWRKDAHLVSGKRVMSGTGLHGTFIKTELEPRSGALLRHQSRCANTKSCALSWFSLQKSPTMRQSMQLPRGYSPHCFRWCLHIRKPPLKTHAARANNSRGLFLLNDNRLIFMVKLFFMSVLRLGK